MNNQPLFSFNQNDQNMANRDFIKNLLLNKYSNPMANNNLAESNQQDNAFPFRALIMNNLFGNDTSINTSAGFSS